MMNDNDNHALLMEEDDPRFDVEKMKQRKPITKQTPLVFGVLVFILAVLAVCILVFFLSLLFTVQHLRTVTVHSDAMNIELLPNNSASIHANLDIPAAFFSVHEVDITAFVCKISTQGGIAGVLESDVIPDIIKGGSRVFRMHLANANTFALDAIKYAWLKGDDIGPVTLACRLHGRLILFNTKATIPFDYTLPRIDMDLAASHNSTKAAAPAKPSLPFGSRPQPPSTTTLVFRAAQDPSASPTPLRNITITIFPNAYSVRGKRVVLDSLTLTLPSATYALTTLPAFPGAADANVSALIAVFPRTTVTLFHKGESEFVSYVDMRLEHRVINRTADVFVHDANATLPSVHHVILKALGASLKDALSALTTGGGSSKGISDLRHGSLTFNASPLGSGSLMTWLLGSHTASLLWTSDTSNPSAAIGVSGFASLTDGQLFEEGNSTFSFQFLGDATGRVDAVWLQVSYRMLSSHRAQLLANVQVDQMHDAWLANMAFESENPAHNITFQQMGLWMGDTDSTVSARVWTTVSCYPDWTVEADNSTIDIDFQNNTATIDVRADYNEVHEKVWAKASYLWSGGDQLLLSGETDVYLKTENNTIEHMLISTPQLSIDRADRTYAATLIVDTFDTYKYLTVYLTGTWSLSSGFATLANARIQVGGTTNPVVTIKGAQLAISINRDNSTFGLLSTSDLNGSPDFLNITTVGRYHDGGHGVYGIDWVYALVHVDAPGAYASGLVTNASAYVDLGNNKWNVTVPVMYGRALNTFDAVSTGTWSTHKGFHLYFSATIANQMYGEEHEGNNASASTTPTTAGEGTGDIASTSSTSSLCAEHLCPTGVCTLFEHLCDGVNHCLDYSDELIGCDGCPLGTLSCGPDTNLCIPKDKLCDGTADCALTGSDEQNCDIYLNLTLASSTTSTQPTSPTIASASATTTDAGTPPRRVALSQYAYGISLFTLNVNTSDSSFAHTLYVLKDHLPNYVGVMVTGNYLAGWQQFYGINSTAFSIDYSHIVPGGIISGTNISAFLTAGDRSPGYWSLVAPITYRRTNDFIELRVVGNYTHDSAGFAFDAQGLYICNNDGGTGVTGMIFSYDYNTHVWNLIAYLRNPRNPTLQTGIVRSGGRYFDVAHMHGFLSATAEVDMRLVWPEAYALVYNFTALVMTDQRVWVANISSDYGSGASMGLLLAASNGVWDRTSDGACVVHLDARVENIFRGDNCTFGLTFANLLLNTTTRAWSAMTNVLYQHDTSYISATASGLYQDGSGGWYGINATSIDVDYRAADPPSGLITGSGITVLVGVDDQLWNVTVPVVYDNGQHSFEALSQGTWMTEDGFYLYAMALLMRDGDRGWGLNTLNVMVNDTTHTWSVLALLQNNQGAAYGSVASTGHYLYKYGQYGFTGAVVSVDLRDIWRELFLTVSNFSGYCDTRDEVWAIIGNGVFGASMHELDVLAQGAWTTTHGITATVSGRGLLTQKPAAGGADEEAVVVTALDLKGASFGVNRTAQTFTAAVLASWDDEQELRVDTDGSWASRGGREGMHMRLHVVAGEPVQPALTLRMEVNATACSGCASREMQLHSDFDVYVRGQNWTGTVVSWVDESARVPQWFMLNMYAQEARARDRASLILALSPHYSRYGFEVEGGLQTEEWTYEAGVAFFIGRMLRPGRKELVMFLTLLASFDFDPLLNINLVETTASAKGGDDGGGEMVVYELVEGR